MSTVTTEWSNPTATYSPIRYINICFIIIAFPVRITSVSWWRKRNGDVTLSSRDLRKESVGEEPGESARVSTKHQQPIRESVPENRGVAQVFPHFSIFGWQWGLGNRVTQGVASRRLTKSRAILRIVFVLVQEKENRAVSDIQLGLKIKAGRRFWRIFLHFFSCSHTDRVVWR